MRRAAIVAGLLMACLVSGSGQLHGQEPGQQWGIGSRGTVNAARANMRTQPALDAAIVTVLIRGIGVVVTDTATGWLKVRADGSGREGWVRTSQLTLTGVVSGERMDSARGPDLRIPIGPATRFETPRSAGLGVMLFGGAALSRVHYSEDIEGFRPVSRTGAVAGVAVSSSPSAPVGVSVSGTWLQSGWRLKGESAPDFDFSGYDWLVKVDYLVLAPAVRVRPGSSPIALLLGGYVAAPLSCSYDYRYPSSLSQFNDSGKCESDDDWKATDYGVGIGAELRRGRVSLGVQYQHGLKDFDDDEAVVRRRTLQVSVGVALR